MLGEFFLLTVISDAMGYQGNSSLTKKWFGGFPKPVVKIAV